MAQDNVPTKVGPSKSGINAILDKTQASGIVKVFDKDGKLKNKMKIVSLQSQESKNAN